MRRWALLLAALLPLHVAAQSYPSKPVRLVNPFTAGGPLDLMGRLLSDKLSGALGKPIIVENRPGAAGNVGAAEVARAPGDGHTLLLTLFSIVTSNPHLYERLPFDPLKDFAPITAIARSDSVVVVHPSVPAASMRELVAHAKANPGRLNYASAGKASPGHLTAEFFARGTGAAFTHVPYKGNAEAIRSVIAGETQIMFTPTTGALPHIKAGKLKALAVYLTDAVDELPGVPSLEGFDQKTVPFWYGLLAPAGTPREIVQRLHAETAKVLVLAEVKAALAKDGTETSGSKSPEDFTAYIADEAKIWARLVKESGVKAE